MISQNQQPEKYTFSQQKRGQSPKIPQKKRKSKGLGLKFWGGLMLVLIVLTGGTFYWLSESDASAVTKKVEQSTADTPIYILGVGLDDNTVPEADGLVVLSMNQEQQYGTVISVLPDINISESEDDPPQLLGTAYQTGGIQALKEKVESTLHIFIPYYVVMRPSTAASWLNSRGKIEFYVEKDMYREADSAVVVNLQQGFQKLDGDRAVSYLRYREEDGSGLARVQRQQRLMKTYLEKLRTQQGWVNYVYTRKNWTPDETNISAKDAAEIVRFLTDIPEEKLRYYITPGQYIQTENGGYWRPDPIGIQNIIGLTLRPDAPVQ